MQTLTFTQKLLRQRRFLSSLIPLLALFLGLGSQSVWAQSAAFVQTTITIAGTSTTGPVTSKIYYGESANTPTGTRPPFDGASLGNYDISTGSLNITASSARIFVNENINFFPVTVTETRFRYRVYLENPLPSPLPLYTTVVLPRFSGTGQSIGTSVYLEATSINVLAGLTSGGTYIFEIIHEVDYNDNTDPMGNGPRTNVNKSGGVGYQATFTVVPPLVTPPGGTTTWISKAVAAGGIGNTDWNMPSNWSNGVPNQFSNAVIPERIVGSANEFLVYPILEDASMNYAVNNLTLSGTAGSTSAELTIRRATLSVFGDLKQPGSGLKGVTTDAPGVANATLNSTIIFAGADQFISGRLGVADIIIAGSGTKSVVNTMLPLNTLSFRPSSVIDGVLLQTASLDVNNGAITTNFDTSGNVLIDLTTSGIMNLIPGSEETISSYVRGILRSAQPLVTGTTQKFGNIGLEMTPNHPKPSVIIFRVVDDVLPNGSAGSVPILRRYEIQGDDENSTSASDIGFRYLPGRELNGIPEANLVMFRTVSKGVPYAPLGGVVNTTTHVVTRPNLVSLARYTLVLGNNEKPLPVLLTAFDAKRVGTDALITWETTSELNSRGYEVQVSTTGKEFRTLASVASATPNTNRTTQYRYIDKEANKSGIRYYRLRQIDLDGKEAFFNPVAVSFTGKATETALVAYPNPINGNEQLHLTFQSASAGKGQISITDMTGRMVRQQPIDVTTGTSDLTVEKLGDLKMGMYLVRLTLPSGQVQNLKVVKQ